MINNFLHLLIWGSIGSYEYALFPEGLGPRGLTASA